jgi:hypothetical protein
MLLALYSIIGGLPSGKGSSLHAAQRKLGQNQHLRMGGMLPIYSALSDGYDDIRSG